MWRGVDEGPVEAGGLRVEGQHQLVLAEQGLWVRLWVGLPLRQRDDPPPAQSVSPAHTKQIKHTFNTRKAVWLITSSMKDVDSSRLDTLDSTQDLGLVNNIFFSTSFPPALADSKSEATKENSLFAFFINVVHFISGGEQKKKSHEVSFLRFTS